MKFRWMHELFNFSRKERTGIISLLCIIFLLIIIGKLIPVFFHSDNPDISEWEAEVNSYLAKKEIKNSIVAAVHPVVFNPNKVDSLSLADMGLPSRVVVNWVRYLEKGGRFRNKEEVKKIFGMTPGLLVQLDSFMVFNKVTDTGVKDTADVSRIKSNIGILHDTILRQNNSKAEKERILQELNSTDSLHLLEISGIGPVFASRIIRYRNLLGGYYAVSQLKEVYGMREENLAAVSQYLTVDKSKLKTIVINFSTVKELGRHPYIGYKTARNILRLKDKIGKFSSPDDLSSVVSSDSLTRLIPYLKFSL
jgi:competence protein ComEA